MFTYNTLEEETGKTVFFFYILIFNTMVYLAPVILIFRQTLFSKKCHLLILCEPSKLEEIWYCSIL